MKKVLEIKDLQVHFATRKGDVQAVNGVSFTLGKGEIMGLVGESGCGKSVTSQAIMRLIGQRKNEKITGEIRYRGEDLLKKSESSMRRIRGKDVSMIFQDPMTSLNPAYKVGAQIAEMPILHQGASTKQGWARAIEMLTKVGIPSPKERASQFPHQYSGGMRQRGVIAMSLSCEPDVIIADEPTTALDVTIQAQVLDLIRDLRNDMGTAILFITHDLGVVAELCDTVAVMYAGRIVEQSSVQQLFSNPTHPYTKGLLASLPKPGQTERLKPIGGQPPNLHQLPSGCTFAERCPYVMEKCQTKQPPLTEREASHHVACWLEEESK